MTKKKQVSKNNDSEAAFDQVGHHFIDYYDTVRGYIRQEIMRQNILPHLGQAPLKVADVGGGDGRDSEWFVRQGHDVTLVDLSAKMLELAAKRDKRIRMTQGDEQTLLNNVGDSAFDVVVSHGVLMYQLDTPQTHLDRLVRLLKPGGILSLLTKGYGGVAERFEQQEKVEELRELQKTHQFVQSKDRLGQRAWAFDERELKEMIESSGARVLSWAGIRVEYDYDRRSLLDVKESELSAILTREAELAHDPARRSKGQMLHFVAQK